MSPRLAVRSDYRTSIKERTRIAPIQRRSQYGDQAEDCRLTMPIASFSCQRCQCTSPCCWQAREPKRRMLSFVRSRVLKQDREVRQRNG